MKLSTSTGLLSSGGQSVSLECSVTAIQLIPDGTNACSLVVYDGTSSAGVAVAKLACAAAQVTGEFYHFDTPVACNKGAFTVLGGSGGTFIIHYSPGM